MFFRQFADDRGVHNHLGVQFADLGPADGTLLRSGTRNAAVAASVIRCSAVGYSVIRACATGASRPLAGRAYVGRSVASILMAIVGWLLSRTLNVALRWFFGKFNAALADRRVATHAQSWHAGRPSSNRTLASDGLGAGWGTGFLAAIGNRAPSGARRLY